MKFFTLDWWRGVQRLEFYDPTPAYQKHLSAIRDRLPLEILALQETVSLHDAQLRLLEFSKEGDLLTLLLDGDDASAGLRQFAIRYHEVVSFKIIPEPTRGLPGPDGFGDLGYDEVDITPDGHFEHCLLFSSGIEMQTVFRNCELEFKDIK